MREHGELRPALGLTHAPDHTNICRLSRLPEEGIGRGLAELALRYARGHSRAHVAVDATGLSNRTINIFFARRMDHHIIKATPLEALDEVLGAHRHR